MVDSEDSGCYGVDDVVFIGHAETVSIVYPYSVFTSMWMTPVLWYVPGGARSAMRRIQERSTTSRGVRRDPPPHLVCAGREGGLGTGAYGRNEGGRLASTQKEPGTGVVLFSLMARHPAHLIQQTNDDQLVQVSVRSATYV